jgi:hypothetical protein
MRRGRRFGVDQKNIGIVGEDRIPKRFEGDEGIVLRVNQGTDDAKMTTFCRET